MGSASDKAKGLYNEGMGKAKQAVAKDGSRLDAEGLAQEGKGKFQQNVGKAKEAIKKGADL